MEFINRGWTFVESLLKRRTFGLSWGFNSVVGPLPRNFLLLLAGFRREIYRNLLAVGGRDLLTVWKGENGSEIRRFMGWKGDSSNSKLRCYFPSASDQLEVSQYLFAWVVVDGELWRNRVSLRR